MQDGNEPSDDGEPTLHIRDAGEYPLADYRVSRTGALIGRLEPAGQIVVSPAESWIVHDPTMGADE